MTAPMTMVRRVLPTTMAVAALAVTLTGTAVAVNGHTAVLGKKNSATAVTTIKNPSGTPLKLTSRKGSPPLTVNGNSTQVPSLDAARLGGLAASTYGDRAVVFHQAGMFNLTVPAGFHHAIVTVQGGGGGGGAAGTAAKQTAGSGGQGGYGVAWVAVTPGEKLQAIVGSGGAAATTGNGGTARESYVRPTVSIQGLHTNVWIVEADGGTGGAGPTNCPGVEAGGVGGAVQGPTPAIAGAGAIGIQAIPGNGGLPASCAITFGLRRQFAFPGLAGTGGVGGTSGGSGPKAGAAGYVSIVYLV